QLLGTEHVDELQVDPFGEHLGVVPRRVPKVELVDVVVEHRHQMRVTDVHGHTGQFAPTHNRHGGAGDRGRPHMHGHGEVVVHADVTVTRPRPHRELRAGLPTGFDEVA